MADVSEQLAAVVVPAQRQADEHRDHQLHGYVGCPGCVAAGVYLCPGCLTPGPGANGLGRHTRCVELWRWALFAVYSALAVGVVVVAVDLAYHFRTIALAAGALGLFAALLWPHLPYLRGLLLRA